MKYRRAISTASAALVLVTAQLVEAQSDEKTYTLEDALQICARIQNVNDRLACFEGLAKSAAKDSSVVTSAPTTDVPTGAAPEIAPAPSEATEESKSRYVIMRADEFEAEKRKAEKPASQPREAYAGTVLRAWEYGNGEYYIALTNGQIWKSEATDKPRPVKDREAVELRPGNFGGWFMYFNTIKRPAVKVRLVE